MRTSTESSAPAPQRRVYSYLRFSTPEQALGDSRRRQVEAAQAWAAARGLTLDDELRDEGVSGYRGANLTAEAALGSFVNAVRGGLVSAGSVLVVESLDRLSRDKLLKAQHLLMSLLLNDITVVTLADGREYSEASVGDNPLDLIASLLVFMRANEESSMKASRLRAAWEGKRERAKASGVRMTTTGPAWLRAEGDGWAVVEERAAVVRRIFDETLRGLGQHAIARRLTTEGLPTWDKGRAWHRTYVRKVLDNPAVLGTLTPHVTERQDGGGRVRRALPPITGYYPAVVDAETWHRVRSLLGTKEKAGAARGRHAGAPVRSLLARLAKCPVCGETMTRVFKGANGGKPKLVCVTAKGGGDCVYRSVSQEAVEGVIFERWPVLVGEAPPSAQGEAEAADAVRGYEVELSQVQDELEELARPRRPLTTAQRAERASLFGELERLQAALDEARHRWAQSGSAIVRHRLDKLAEALERGPEDDLSEANRALREAVSGVVVDYHHGQLVFEWRHGGVTALPYRYDWG